MNPITKAFDDLAVRESTQIAVLDIGSNSFHLVVARIISGTVQILHKTKIKVRLADGLDCHNTLSNEAIERGLQALEVIKTSLAGFAPNSVKIVATYTLRKARNAHQFISEAKQILPYPVEIIAGQEEARLIFNGVAHTESLDDKTLVMDIGGGSTEFIIGEKLEPILLRSLDMGCVSFTQQFFAKSPIKAKHFDRAITAAQQELELIEDKYINIGWQKTVGTSGTIESLILQSGKGSELHNLSLSDLETIKQNIISAGCVSKLDLPHVNDDRKQVFPAGLAILIAIFKSLKINSLSYAQAALREGVIYEMESSLTNTNIRERSAQSLATRYDVDTKQAKLVLDTCFSLFEQAKQHWHLNEARLKPLLGWSALLHEVGLHINSRGVQRHSAYILQNAELPGFNSEQQTFIATLARFHRKKIKLEEIPQLTQFSHYELLNSIALIRLAVLLNIKRQQEFLPEYQFEVDKNKLNLHFPSNWLKNHPVITADLEKEREQLANVNIQLSFM